MEYFFGEGRVHFLVVFFLFYSFSLCFTRLLSVTREMLWVLLIETFPRITGQDEDD